MVGGPTVGCSASCLTYDTEQTRRHLRHQLAARYGVKHHLSGGAANNITQAAALLLSIQHLRPAAQQLLRASARSRLASGPDRTEGHWRRIEGATPTVPPASCPRLAQQGPSVGSGRSSASPRQAHAACFFTSAMRAASGCHEFLALRLSDAVPTTRV